MQGRSGKVGLLVQHLARWLRGEEAGSSNLPTPTSSEGIRHVPDLPGAVLSTKHRGLSRPG